MQITFNKFYNIFFFVFFSPASGNGDENWGNGAAVAHFFFQGLGFGWWVVNACQTDGGRAKLSVATAFYEVEKRLWPRGQEMGAPHRLENGGMDNRNNR